MTELKEDYVLANCCSPQDGDNIIGYYSHDNIIKVHKSSCANLNKADRARLIELDWNSITAPGEFKPGSDYDALDEIDFAILKHHQELGIDYSLKVGAVLRLDRQTVFERHRRLREMKLLRRVDPLMIQYRKGIAKHKWIKHRNHTYYELTEKGKNYIEYHQSKI